MSNKDASVIKMSSQRFYIFLSSCCPVCRCFYAHPFSEGARRGCYLFFSNIFPALLGMRELQATAPLRRKVCKPRPQEEKGAAPRPPSSGRMKKGPYIHLYVKDEQLFFQRCAGTCRAKHWWASQVACLEDPTNIFQFPRSLL